MWLPRCRTVDRPWTNTLSQSCGGWWIHSGVSSGMYGEKLGRCRRCQNSILMVKSYDQCDFTLDKKESMESQFPGVGIIESHQRGVCGLNGGDDWHSSPLSDWPLLSSSSLSTVSLLLTRFAVHVFAYSQALLFFLHWVQDPPFISCSHTLLARWQVKHGGLK